MDEDTLHEVELRICQEIIDIAPYAGNALFDGDESEIRFWKGQHIALERLRKYISKKQIQIMVEEENKSYSDYVKEQLATLKDSDHKLFDDVVNGLNVVGWTDCGGSDNFRLLNLGDLSIKVFRDPESPEVIRICFAAQKEGDSESINWPKNEKIYENKDTPEEET